jgi:hypothetical protein
MTSSSHRPILFLPFLRLPIPRLDSTRMDYNCMLRCIPSRLLTVHFCNNSARTPRKTLSSLVKIACLLVRYLAIDVLFFHAFASAGICLASRWLAMGIHVTILRLFFSLALLPQFGPWPAFMKLSVSLRFSRSQTVGGTSWVGDQLVARPLPVHKHRKTHARTHTHTHTH